MKRSRLRRAIPTTALALVLIAGWYWLAPTQFGGSTTYVTTNGISMLPRFHTGDLALVRPLRTYRVGEIVAYHSSLLHVTVLHRIIAIQGDRYVFKGDNNNFIDPTRPTRSQLIGALWLRVPRGGVILKVLHSPVMVGTVLAVVGLLLLWGVFETRRSSRRRRRGRPGAPVSHARAPGGGAPPSDLRPFLLVSASAAGVLVLIGLLAFTKPASITVSRPLTYTQSVHFGYSAPVSASPVYPDGLVRTGQPVFLELVSRLRVSADYRLLASAPAQLHGAEQLLLVITGPSGWTRTFALGRAMPFRGPHVAAQATLDLPSLERLLNQIQRLTGIAAEGASSIAVELHVHVLGRLGGRRLDSAFSPALSFGLQPLQLLPAGGPSAPGSASGGLDPARAGAIPTSASVPNHLHLLGQATAVEALRWLSLAGFLLCGGAALALFVLIRVRDPFAEAERIRARYGHLLVPVIAAPATLEHVPYDVAEIGALVRLAEAGQRLILHHRDPIGDTYLVSDDTTVYRYRPGPARVVWGEWSTPAPNGHHPGANGHAARGEHPRANGHHPAGLPHPTVTNGGAPDASAAVGVPVSAFATAAAPAGRSPRGAAQLTLAALGVLVGLRRSTRR